FIGLDDLSPDGAGRRRAAACPGIRPLAIRRSTRSLPYYAGRRPGLAGIAGFVPATEHRRHAFGNAGGPRISELVFLPSPGPDRYLPVALGPALWDSADRRALLVPGHGLLR